MGTWGDAPWDNDAAADWFDEMFEDTGLAERVEETLKADIAEHHEEIRSAAYMVLALGYIYVWPIDDLHRIVELAAQRLEDMLADEAWLEIYAEVPEIVEAVREEASTLRERLTELKTMGEEIQN